jgi:uncharacterized membrane protein
MVAPNSPGPDPGSPEPILAYLEALNRRLTALETYLDFRAPAVATPPPVPTAATPAAEPKVEQAVVVAAPVHAAAPAAAAEPIAPPPIPAARPWPPAPVGIRSKNLVHTGAPDASLAAPASAPSARPAPAPPLSFRELEARMTGRALAWAGGAALIIGVVFFLSLAFSRGWITEEMRVAIGLIGGSIAIGVAAWCFERAQPMLGTVLSAVGLGTLSLALYAATRLYGFVAPEVALAGSFAAAVIAAGIAIRYDTQVVAAFGLVAVVAAPPVLGASGNLVTMAFLGTALVGTTVIALFRSWPWLPRLAFVLAAPQVLFWVVGEPPPDLALGVVVLAAFWALNAAAATGTELPPARTVLGRPSAALLLANALFAVVAGALLVRGESRDLAAALLGLLGVAHLVLAGYLFRLRGDHHPFGLLAAGIAVTLVVAAVPVAYDGARVPLLWTALAVALCVPYARRRHGYAAAGAIVVADMAILHLVGVGYPWSEWSLGGAAVSGTPFDSEGGVTLAGLLVGALVAGWLVREMRVQAGLLVVATLLVAYSLPYEMTGLPLVVGWLALALALLGGQRLLDRRLGPPVAGAPLAATPSRWLAGPAVIAVGLAVANLVVLQLPVADLEAVVLPATPFTDERTLYTALVVAALLAAAAATVEPIVRAAAVVVATVVTGYLMLFEIGPTATVVAWCGLAALQAAAIRLDPAGRLAYLATAGAAVALAATYALVAVVPPSRLSVTAEGLAGHPPFVSEATIALGALAAALAAGAWFLRGSPIAAWLRVAAGITIVYLLSVGVVDIFAGQVGGSVSLEELQRQAQVALSILWAAIGFGAFAVGAVRNLALAREFGLALLAIATVKVFVFDLSFLDVAYRVLSFIGLGLLLLAGAFVYQSHRPRPGGQGRAA